MAELIKMPQLSDTMEEGTVVSWAKKVGDKVKEGDILAEIETDKAIMEFESFYEGTLLHIGIGEGETVKVESLIAIIGSPDENISDLINANKQDSIDVETKSQESTTIESVAVESSLPDEVHVVPMPRLSDTMEEGKVVKWIKKIGDAITEGDVLAEIETDKATMEFESPYEGVLIHIGIPEDGIAKVDKVLAIIGDSTTDVTSILKGLENQNTIEESDSSQTKSPLIPDIAKSNSIQPNATKRDDAQGFVSPIPHSDRIFISPLAKRLATERQIDPKQVTGTGTNGRIIKRDIESYKQKAVSETRIFENEESQVEIPNTPMRKAIAKRLSASKFSAPHYYLTAEFDVQNLISFREQYNTSGKYKISFNDLIMKAVALSLREHPQVNASWKENFITRYAHVHLGVAIGVEDGLVVPVVRFADSLPIHEIGSIVKDFAQRAQSKRLKQDEIEGSTFTVSNLGMFGITEFTSIINSPNVAILSVGSIVEKPIVKNGQILVGHSIKVTLANDHRVVDGLTGAKFLQTLRTYLENPVSLLIA